MRKHADQTNPISDWRKDQQPFLLIDPKNIGAKICDNCGSIYPAGYSLCPACNN